MFVDILAALGVLVIFLGPFVWLYNKSKNDHYNGL